MESLYVLEPGAYLRREGGSLKVVRGDQVIDHIPCSGLKRLMLIGYISLSGPVLDFLISNRVETVFVTPTGRFRARLGLDEHRHVALRKSQYLGLSSEKFALSQAQKIVEGKLINYLRFLMLRARQYQSEELKNIILRLKPICEYARTADNMEKLRGMEGLGTRLYFSAFPYLIRNKEFSFTGRNRRPPKDPVNAMLSFVYTLLTNEVLSAIKTCGLDPYLGALHEIEYGRPSLACDLVEEYRAYLGDRMVLGLINKKLVRPDDFIFRETGGSEFTDEKEMAEKRPVEMKPGISRTFIASYEEMMRQEIFYPPLEKKVTHRWLILNQARRFGKSLEKDEELYQPFLWE
jgi:CRISPR-associated protein Cas1